MPVAAETKQFPCAACGVSCEPPIKRAVYQLFDFLCVVAIGKLAGKTICALVQPAINAKRDTVNRAPSVARVRNHNGVSDFRQSEPTSIGREGSFFRNLDVVHKAIEGHIDPAAPEPSSR